MDGAKACVAACELPTGVVVGDQVLKTIKYRELAGPEEDILASNMGAGAKMTSVMANCTLELGGLTIPGEIKKAIEKLVITDRWFYLVQLRILSLGSSYNFETSCPHCNGRDKITYDLGSVKVKNAPDAKQLYSEITLARSGKKIRFRVADGETDTKIEKMATAGKEASVALFARVTDVDDRPATLSDVINLPMADRSMLRKAMDEKEGEFDDEFDRTCPNCGEVYKGQLQLDGKTFFSL